MIRYYLQYIKADLLYILQKVFSILSVDHRPSAKVSKLWKHADACAAHQPAVGDRIRRNVYGDYA